MKRIYRHHTTLIEYAKNQQLLIIMAKTTPTPYTISVPDAALEKLKAKLAAATFPDELEASQWEYGAVSNELSALDLNRKRALERY